MDTPQLVKQSFPSGLSLIYSQGSSQFEMQRVGAAAMALWINPRTAQAMRTGVRIPSTHIRARWTLQRPAIPDLGGGDGDVRTS